MSYTELSLDLPTEVWLVIIGHASRPMMRKLRPTFESITKGLRIPIDSQTIRSLCLTCRMLRRLAQPILFQRLRLDFVYSRPESRRSLEDFYTSLNENQIAKGWIQDLTIAIRFSASTLDPALTNTCERLICSLSNLHTLVLEGMDISADTLEAIRCMQQLKYLLLSDVICTGTRETLSMDPVDGAQLNELKVFENRSDAGQTMTNDALRKILAQSQTSLRRIDILSYGLSECLFGLAARKEVGIFNSLEKVEICTPLDWSLFFAFVALCPCVRYLGIYPKDTDSGLPLALPPISYFPALHEYWGPIDLGAMILPLTASVHVLNLSGRMSAPHQSLLTSDLARVGQAIDPSGRLTLSAFEWRRDLLEDVAQFFPNVSRLYFSFCDEYERFWALDHLKDLLMPFRSLETVEFDVINAQETIVGHVQKTSETDRQKVALEALKVSPKHPLKQASFHPLGGTWRYEDEGNVWNWMDAYSD